MSPFSSRTIRMSSPRTFSGFNGDEPMSSSYKTAGRRFANRFISLRKPRMPCSGRNARSSFDEQFEFEEAPFGGAGYEASGRPLPEATLALAQLADAVIVGATGVWKYDIEDLDRLSHDLGTDAVTG
jgi:hypothetical protein